MKTDDLVAALAAGVEPVPQGLVSRRLGQALLFSFSLSVAIMVLDYGVRPDLREAMGVNDEGVGVALGAGVGVALGIGFSVGVGFAVNVASIV